LKPDITAPGVGIVAARVKGTPVGDLDPVDDFYSRLSGTSMATPHVAGAAAILAQEYPDWTARQLKAVLMSTATPTSRVVGTIKSGPHAGTEYAVFSASGTKPINANASISGAPMFVGEACDPLPAAGGVALIERGTCTFQTKLDNITAAGYDAGIVFNAAQPGCLDQVAMNASGNIPFVFVSRLAGLQLLQDPDVTGDNACTTVTPSTGSPVASTTVEAVPAGNTVYEQGAGRVDVARAFKQKVYATTPNLDFGEISSAQGDNPISKPLGYTNDTDQPVTLTLNPELLTAEGEAAPDDALTVDAATLTVPAGGSATVTVTLDPTAIDFDDYTGAVIATADNIQLTTPVGLSKLVRLTIHVVSDRVFTTNAFGGILPVELEHGTAPAFAPDVVRGFRIGPRAKPGPGGLFEATGTAFVPPGTYHVERIASWFDDDGIHNLATLVDPQTSVTDDTEVTLDIRQAQPITVTTPRPADPVYFVPRIERTGADGQMYISTTIPGQFLDNTHLWASPTERVTRGIFRYSTEAVMANPQLTMTVDQPQRRQLNVISRGYADRGVKFADLSNGWVPFTKDQTLPLVDAGFGDPQDIDGLDLHGKLALLRFGDIDPATGFPRCRPLIDRMENVRQVGAVGVVWFRTSTNTTCTVPSTPQDLTEPIAPTSLPEAWLGPAEGQRLADQAANGTVLIDVNANPNVEYSYDLTEYEEQQIPSSLHYTLTSRDLVQFNTEFHSSEPVGGSSWFAFKPGVSFGITRDFYYAAPQARPVYIGPVSPDAVWEEHTATYSRDPQTGRVSATPTDEEFGPYRRLDQPIQTSEQRNAVPFAPGPRSLNAVQAAQPDTPIDYAACALCREGDTFWPQSTPIGSNGQEVVLRGNTLTQHLFQANGEELPLMPHGALGFPGATLPEQPGTYSLVNEDTLTNGSRIHTTWTFTSPGSPQQTTTQPGYACLGLSTQPCRPEPAIFLGYDLGNSLGLDNTVAAPGRSNLRVSVYHNPASTLPMPAIAGLKLWASTDDGAHWRQLPVARLTKGSDATFTATITYPALADTTGTVTLRAEAWDSAGNRTEQTLTHAYNLRSTP
jgi:hypothetical protein